MFPPLIHTRRAYTNRANSLLLLLIAITPLMPYGSAIAQGLQGAYFAGNLFDEGPVTEQVDGPLDWNWGGESPFGEELDFPSDQFSIRWSGGLVSQYSGLHQISARADDGVRIWVDGALIIDEWRGNPGTVVSGSVQLTAGRRADVVIDYVEFGGNARLSLSWSHPEFPEELIPAAAMSPTPVPSNECRLGLRLRDPQAFEGRGSASFTVHRSRCLSSPVVARLGYEGPEGLAERLDAPGEVELRAQQSAATITLSLPDNDEAQGLQRLTVTLLYDESYERNSEREVQLRFDDDERPPMSPRYTIAGEVLGLGASDLARIEIEESAPTARRWSIAQVGEGPFSSPLLPAGRYVLSAFFDRDGDGIQADDEPTATLEGVEERIELPPDQLALRFLFRDAVSDAGSPPPVGNNDGGAGRDLSIEDGAVRVDQGRAPDEGPTDEVDQGRDVDRGSPQSPRAVDTGCTQPHQSPSVTALFIILILSIMKRSCYLSRGQKGTEEVS
ncbi:MAG: PA14 domain-containing protein [Myxococcota bacterium]|nr:PA14 domain-containing protein [Myxococcota bacterium]